MYRSTTIVAACLTLGLLMAAAPAQAQGVTVSDPAGDVSGPGLDITGVTFANADQEFRTSLTFVSDAPDTVVIAVGLRHGHLVRVVSEHQIKGADNTFLLDRLGRTLTCSGLSSSWDRPAASLVLRVPAQCLQRGDYGAVRAWSLTEDSASGQDEDYAPETANGEIRFTGWIPRG